LNQIHDWPQVLQSKSFQRVESGDWKMLISDGESARLNLENSPRHKLNCHIADRMDSIDSIELGDSAKTYSLYFIDHLLTKCGSNTRAQVRIERVLFQLLAFHDDGFTVHAFLMKCC
jgi:hypothetical protein